MRRMLKGLALMAATGSLALNAFFLMSKGSQQCDDVLHPAPSSEVSRHGSAEVGKGSLSQFSDQIRQKELEIAMARGNSAEARIKRLLPLGERFETYQERDIEQETRVSRLLSQVFQGRQSEYRVECHEAVCKLVNSGKIEDEEWMHELQSNTAIRSAFERISFGRDGTFVEMVDEGVAAGRKFFGEVFAALEASDAAHKCKAKSSAVGDLELSLVFFNEEHRVEPTAGGELASDEFGKCVLQVLRDVLISHPVPFNVTVVPDWPLTVSLP